MLSRMVPMAKARPKFLSPGAGDGAHTTSVRLRQNVVFNEKTQRHTPAGSLVCLSLLLLSEAKRSQSPRLIKLFSIAHFCAVAHRHRLAEGTKERGLFLPQGRSRFKLDLFPLKERSRFKSR